MKHKLPHNDPLARAIVSKRSNTILACVGNEFFWLTQWSMRRGDDGRELETQWIPVRDEIRRITLPLRWRVRMKLMYWRQKAFG